MVTMCHNWSVCHCCYHYMLSYCGHCSLLLSLHALLLIVTTRSHTVVTVHSYYCHFALLLLSLCSFTIAYMVTISITLCVLTRVTLFPYHIH